MTMANARHCKHCGSEKNGESVPTRGSDTIPVYECPDCGSNYATKCDCDNPKSHGDG